MYCYNGYANCSNMKSILKGVEIFYEETYILSNVRLVVAAVGVTGDTMLCVEKLVE